MKKRSLNFKLLTGGTLCVLIPLLAFAIFSDIQLSKDMKATNEQSTLNIAKSLSTLTQTVLQGEIKLARDMAVGNTTIEVAAKVAEAGIADSSAEIQRLEQTLAVKFGKTGYPFMVDRNGLLIVHPDSKHILELNLATLYDMKLIMDKMLAQQTGVEAYTFEGIEKIAGFAPVELTGWSIGVTQPMVEYMGSAIALRKAMLLVSIVFLGIALAAICFFSRSISKPICQIIEGLNEGADQVASAAGEVSSASQTLAQGSSEQAASIEEISAALEEMSSMTKQNANNAGQAHAMMKEATASVQTASASMSELTSSMSDILKASDETSKIIKTIDEIAAASSEQAKGIEQVNISVSEMDKVTQQNAATAEESSSASEEMNAQAEQMKGIVNDLVSLIRGDDSKQHKRPQARPKKSTKPVRLSINPKTLPSKHARFPLNKKVHPDQIVPFDEKGFKDL